MEILNVLCVPLWPYNFHSPQAVLGVIVWTGRVECSIPAEVRIACGELVKLNGGKIELTIWTKCF